MTRKPLERVVLSIAIGALARFVWEMKGQSMTSPAIQVPFLHGPPTGPIGNQSGPASLDRAN
jgi:hypothetical protein